MIRYDAGGAVLQEPARTDVWLWMIPLILSGLGILMVTSTTSNFVNDASGSPFRMGIRQFASLVVGFAAMLAVFCAPLKFWRVTATLMWMVAVLMLLATLVIGRGGGGANRWIILGGVSIQPSEIMILAVVLEVGKIFEKHGDDAGTCFYIVMTLIVITAIPLLLQPDLGSTILLGLVCMGMFAERFGWKFPLAAGLAGSLMVALLIAVASYRMRRVYAFLDPFSDPLDAGFQTIQGLIAFANGNLWGAGLGHGFQKLQYLPAAYTDFIYAALGEELGLLGTLGIISLACMWAMRCRSLYKRVPDGYPSSVVWGLTLTVILPMCINIAGVTNLMPLTGMPLPFVSYGGSSLVMSWVRVGILLRLQKDAATGALG